MNRIAPASFVMLMLAAVAACSDDGGVPLTTTDATPRLSHAGPSAIQAPVPIGVEVVATGFTSPVQLVQAPGSNGRRFVVDQDGQI